MELVKFDITKPLPPSGVVDSTYQIEGTVKLLDTIGAPPFVYLEQKKKDWLKPDILESVDYQRLLPTPISGAFKAKFKPDKTGDYEFRLIATPSLLRLPVLEYFPTVGETEVMKVSIGQRPPAVFRFSSITIDGHEVDLTNHDGDSGLLFPKTTADSLEIGASFEWTGPAKAATVSIKAGYKDLTLGFTPKTGAYVFGIQLPESPETPFQGKLTKSIKVPLTAAGGLSDGAIEVVAKIPGASDYISRIWNVFTTKTPGIDFAFGDRTANPSTVAPGGEVTINIPVTYRSAASGAVSASAKVLIYEGSALPGAGKPLASIDVPAFSITPNETHNVAVKYVATAGTIDRRDVGIEIYVAGQKVKDGQWDDVFYVSGSPSTPGTEILEVHIDPPGAGTVATSPAPVSGTENNWAFLKGTVVTVTAKPYPDYKFKSWSGEMTDTTAITAPVYEMTENRIITAHFELIQAVAEELLEVKIDPAGAGKVSVSPAPSSGSEHYWYFPKGTTVYVTAQPNSGYRFKSWSGEMTDTTAITAPVYQMTEKRTITAHFESEYVPPPPSALTHKLTIGIDPSGGGSVRHTDGSPIKASYSDGEFVSLEAIPAQGYEFSYWEFGGEFSYYSTITIPMDRDRSVLARFKPIPPSPETKVSLAVVGDGFPLGTRYWRLNHHNYQGVIDWSDGINHGVNDIIQISNVQSAGALSCFTADYLGNWSEQKFSRYFAAVQGGSYRYDIASGVVYGPNGG